MVLDTADESQVTLPEKLFTFHNCYHSASLPVYRLMFLSGPSPQPVALQVSVPRDLAVELTVGALALPPQEVVNCSQNRG